MWYTLINPRGKGDKMLDYDKYTVYENSTNKVVFSGTFVECEDYIDNPKYSVVWNINGMVL